MVIIIIINIIILITIKVIDDSNKKKKVDPNLKSLFLEIEPLVKTLPSDIKVTIIIIITIIIITIILSSLLDYTIYIYKGFHGSIER